MSEARAWPAGTAPPPHHEPPGVWPTPRTRRTPVHRAPELPLAPARCRRVAGGAPRARAGRWPGGEARPRGQVLLRHPGRGAVAPQKCREHEPRASLCSPHLTLLQLFPAQRFTLSPNYRGSPSGAPPNCTIFSEHRSKCLRDNVTGHRAKNSTSYASRGASMVQQHRDSSPPGRLFGLLFGSVAGTQEARSAR
jgi:hypothetical protein